MKSKELFEGYVVAKDGTITKSDGTPVKVFKSNKYKQCCLFDVHGKKYVLECHGEQHYRDKTGLQTTLCPLFLASRFPVSKQAYYLSWDFYTP